jgi:moderate conductance mechanosensitive channel
VELDLSVWELPIRLVLVIAIAVVARVILGFAIKRAVKAVVAGARVAAKNGIQAERVKQRSRTIGSVLDNLATTTITLTALAMVLSELGVNIGALIAVSTILGAAVGFGAQSLVKDIISGVFIVFEDQYGVGDWIKVGAVSGEVERIRLRVTEVRDTKGTLWFIRNGEILTVGNASQEWSKALLDLSLEYDTEVEDATKLVAEIAADVAADPEFSGLVLEPIPSTEVYDLTGSKLTLRVSLRTLPGKQWIVAAELRKRIKNAFDQAGIKLL